VRETRHVCGLLVESYEGKTAIERDRPRKEDSIKMNLYRLKV